MDFEFLPPEINSGLIYSGPGCGPLLAAAASWDSLAAELDTAAQTYRSVLSGLTGLFWHGDAAAAMATSATPFISWLHTTADQTKQTATQARAAAAAYELAHALTVPPPAVTANRIQLATLVATNFFGQNTAAIAATEAQYAEYWAQDAAAMSGYAASSGAATQLTPFASPDRTTDPVGLNAQSAAVDQAHASPVASNPPLLQNFALLQRPLTVAFDPTLVNPADVNVLVAIRVVGTALNGAYKMEATSSGVIGAEHDLDLLPSLGTVDAAAAVTAAPRLTVSAASLGQVTATLSRAGTIGSLSVPTTWAWGSPVSAPPAGGQPAFGATAESAVGSGLSGLPGLPALTPSRPTIVVPRYGRRILTVMGRPPAAG